MVRRKWVFGAATILALAGARPAAAGPISFATGDAEKDMASSIPGVLTIVNRTSATDFRAPAQPLSMTQAGRVNGWVIKDVRVYYDRPDDRLYVGVNFFGIAGDADGNGVVGSAAPGFIGTEQSLNRMLNSTDSTITVGMDLTNSGKPTFVAGLSSDKNVVGPGTNGFSVNWYNETNAGLGTTYGASLNQHNLNLAFNPSAEHPDFLFSIGGLSQIPGFDLNKGIGFRVKAGSSMDGEVGEEDVDYTHVDYQQITPPPPPSPEPPPPVVPEPATMLAWSLVAGGAAWRGASRRRKGDRSAS